jgi:hypothetical protein
MCWWHFMQGIHMILSAVDEGLKGTSKELGVLLGSYTFSSGEQS